MTFGEKVKAERTKLGMSQDELAAKIGVTRRIIGSYENDKSRPRGMERYKKLAESLIGDSQAGEHGAIFVFAHSAFFSDNCSVADFCFPRVSK